jgi:hypothetical protein
VDFATKWAETNAAWNFLIDNNPVPPKAPAPRKTPVNVATQFAVWQNTGEALAEMNLHDPAGNTWTHSEFKGKMTFVTVWAT